MKFRITYLLILLMVAVSCATTETATEDEERGRPIFEIDEEVAEAFFEEEMDEFDHFIYERRSHLTDQFAFLEHEIPDAYLQEAVHEQHVDEYAGYRVQILSTRNIAEADSVRDEFRAWVMERMGGFQPEAYVQFRQPTYRVRAGDFRNRNRAIEFSRIVKDKFPEAWVVHDRIEPQQVPADTTVFRLLEPGETNLINIFIDYD